MLELNAGAGVVGVARPPGEEGMTVVVELQGARGDDAHDHCAGDPLGGAGHVWVGGGWEGRKGLVRTRATGQISETSWGWGGRGWGGKGGKNKSSGQK